MVSTVSKRRAQPRSDLGRRLLALIERKGYANIRAAADASGIHHQVLYDLVGGQDPRVSTLERVVAALGGTMAEFYAPTGQAKPR